MENIQFKVATISDTELILPLVKEFYDYDGLNFVEEKARMTLIGILNDRSLGMVWLILDGSDVVGYSVLTLGYSLEYQGRDSFIDEIYLKESHRRKGIGTKALEIMLEYCKEIKVRALHLEVERTNNKAQAFYEKAGFKDHARRLMTLKVK